MNGCARARVVWVRGALGPCRCVVWRGSVLSKRCGRGLPVKEPGLIALWQRDQRCGRSVGSWMACGGRQGWSGARVLVMTRGSRHFMFSGRAHWSKVTKHQATSSQDFLGRGGGPRAQELVRAVMALTTPPVVRKSPTEDESPFGCVVCRP